MGLAHGGKALQGVAVALAQRFASGDDAVRARFAADLCEGSSREHQCCSEHGRP